MRPHLRASPSRRRLLSARLRSCGTQHSAISTQHLANSDFAIRKRVILSAVAAARSATATESKDPADAGSDQGSGKVFAPCCGSGWGELPESLLLEFTCLGSFDCVCRRFAPANSAQDDSVKNGGWRGLDMSPKKKSAYAVPKLKDFSTAA